MVALQFASARFPTLSPLQYDCTVSPRTSRFPLSQTEAGRDRRERLLERRQAANEARLAKIRRRKAAAGLPTGEEPLSKRAPVENKEGDDAGNVDEVSIDAFLRDVWGSDETGPS